MQQVTALFMQRVAAFAAKLGADSFNMSDLYYEVPLSNGNTNYRIPTKDDIPLGFTPVTGFVKRLSREDVFLITHISYFVWNDDTQQFQTGQVPNGLISPTNNPSQVAPFFTPSYLWGGGISIIQTELTILKDYGLGRFMQQEQIQAVLLDPTTPNDIGLVSGAQNLEKIKGELNPYIVFSGDRSIDLVLTYNEAPSTFLPTSNSIDRVVIGLHGVKFPSASSKLAMLDAKDQKII